MGPLLRLLLVWTLVVAGVTLATPVVAAADSPDPATSSSTPSSSATASPSTSPSTKPDSPTQGSSARSDGGGVANHADVADDPGPATTIDAASEPTRPSLSRDQTFRFSAPEAGLQFECQLVGPGQTPGFADCPTTSGDGTSTGEMTYSNLDPSADTYTFTVHAYRTADGSVGASDSVTWRIYSVFSPSNVPVRTGATFNNPRGNELARRTNIRRVINAIRSMPGYVQPDATPGAAPCPRAGSPLIPSKIRITLYSMTDGRFGHALIDAARRCVSVQILMNSHLSAKNDPAWRVLQNAIGNSVRARNFARRCGDGCRGRGVMHTKMYLFDSSVPEPLSAKDTLQNVVMVGSSNMTANATRVQWNDLYAAHGAALFNPYDKMFDLLKIDKGFHRNQRDFVAGPYRTTFWPVRAGRTEPYVSLFHSIKCHGVSGAGVGGRTVIYINMHAWFGARGVAIERAVKRLYHQGCVIKVLYSFMTKGVYHRLKGGTGARMSVRRTVFSLDGDKYADLYSHFKAIAVSGNVGGVRNAHVVWTGSNNFTSGGAHNDEVMLRIASARAYRQYRDRFRLISRRHSSAHWAYFFERAGGGRAPAAPAFGADDPTVLSPAVRRDKFGNPEAVD